MPSDPAAFNQAMMAAGHLAQGDMAASFAAFQSLGLGSGERLAAIASVAAAVATKRYGTAPDRFLTEILSLVRPAMTKPTAVTIGASRPARIAEGVALLEQALDRLATRLTGAGIRSDGAALVETMLLTRLLSPHGTKAVGLALAAARRAVARPGYHPGEIVAAALGERELASAR